MREIYEIRGENGFIGMTSDKVQALALMTMHESEKAYVLSYDGHVYTPMVIGANA